MGPERQRHLTAWLARSQRASAQIQLASDVFGSTADGVEARGG